MSNYIAKLTRMSYDDLATSVQARWPWIDVVRDCGAVGDGATDDTQAFKDAVDLATTDNRPVMIPVGTYAIASPVDIDDYITMFGVGNPRKTVLYSPNGSNIFNLTGGADYSVFENLKFLGPTGLGIGLYLYDVRETVISRCVFSQLQTGIQLETYTQGAWYNNFNNCFFDSNLSGVRLVQASGGTRNSNRNNFSGCVWLGSTNYHVYMHSGDTNYFMRCNFGSAPVMIYMNVRYTGFVGCCFEGKLADTDIWIQSTATGLDFYLSNCTLAHGVFDLNASTDCRIHSAGNYSGLSTNTFNNYKQSDRWIMGSASAYPLRFEVDGDTEPRGVIRADGRLIWGDGSAAGDVNLYRGAAGYLQTDDSFIVGSATNGWLQLSQQNYVTISGGAITPTGTMTKVETEGAAASDDLDTINGGYAGRLLILEAYSGSHDVVVKHGTGNIYLSGAADVTLDSRRDKLMLVYTTEGTWNALAPVASNG